MSDYTPSTGEVRASYLGDPENWLDEQIAAEFDRWLDEERAKAWGEGARAGYRTGMADSYLPDNPYRKADS